MVQILVQTPQFCTRRNFSFYGNNTKTTAGSDHCYRAYATKTGDAILEIQSRKNLIRDKFITHMLRGLKMLSEKKIQGEGKHNKY